jgi:predicted transcriptional regulator
MQNDLSKFHGELASRMMTGFQSLNHTVLKSKAEVLATLTDLNSAQKSAIEVSEINILSGQQNLARTLTRAVQNIKDASEKDEKEAVESMKKLLSDHIAATDALLHMAMEGRDNQILAQFQLLVSITVWMSCIF